MIEICCDTCPFWPTCEDENEFTAQIFGLDEWGEEYPDGYDR